ncbi:hypothetical protein [Streptomyces sp. ISL-96]|uniref:hypothetical protein n=1 Tax=Streptomyces sp. ISL-96 TaxID=2819191 RepID=UPI0020364403|nr:hypothetical protein [Streptomyces sp. ISL-96]
MIPSPFDHGPQHSPERDLLEEHGAERYTDEHTEHQLLQGESRSAFVQEGLPRERHGQTQQIDHHDGTDQDQSPAQSPPGRACPEAEVRPAEAVPPGDQQENGGRGDAEGDVPVGAEPIAPHLYGSEHRDDQSDPHRRTRIAETSSCPPHNAPGSRPPCRRPG